jgi:hypothetical protein
MRKEKEVNVEDKTWKIKEFLASEVDTIDFTDVKGAIKSQVMLATGMSESDYLQLTFKERLNLMTEINSLNGLADFQKPAV